MIHSAVLPVPSAFLNPSSDCILLIVNVGLSTGHSAPHDMHVNHWQAAAAADMMPGPEFDVQVSSLMLYTPSAPPISLSHATACGRANEHERLGVQRLPVGPSVLSSASSENQAAEGSDGARRGGGPAPPPAAAAGRPHHACPRAPAGPVSKPFAVQLHVMCAECALEANKA